MALSQFLHMGGYAQYVWPAYGLTAAVFLLNVWLPLRQYRCLRHASTS